MNTQHLAVYILSNRYHGTLYIGVTGDLLQRIYQHKQGYVECFASRYGCKKLVYYELFEDMYLAISREKQLKAGCRQKKIDLIDAMNPKWDDLYEGLL